MQHSPACYRNWEALYVSLLFLLGQISACCTKDLLTLCCFCQKKQMSLIWIVKGSCLPFDGFMLASTHAMYLMWIKPSATTWEIVCLLTLFIKFMMVRSKQQKLIYTFSRSAAHCSGLIFDWINNLYNMIINWNVRSPLLHWLVSFTQKHCHTKCSIQAIW